jgi:hypothetical protein
VWETVNDSATSLARAETELMKGPEEAVEPKMIEGKALNKKVA